MKKLENLKPVITCVFVVRIGIEVPKLATNMGAYDKFRVFFATRRLLRFFAWKTRHNSCDGFSTANRSWAEKPARAEGRSA